MNRKEKDMNNDGWKAAAFDRAGYNGIREEHIEAVADELAATGLTTITRDDFDRACLRQGIDGSNFKQSDLDRLKELLNK